MEADGYLIDHTKFDWKNLLGPWEWLLEDEMAVSPWLVSRFGDLFFVDATGLVHWLNISDGELIEVATSEDEFIELLAVEARTSLDDIDARREALTGCLGKIHPDHRRLVAHRYQPGATTRSVAESLGRSVQGTRQALHRIRSRLLACTRS